MSADADAHATTRPSTSAGEASTLDGETALRFAAEVRALLAAQPEAEALLEALGSLALPALGDLCVIDIVDATGPRRRVVASRLPPDVDARVREYFATYPAIVDFTGEPA